MNTPIIEAILKINPNAKVFVDGETITWLDNTPPVDNVTLCKTRIEMDKLREVEEYKLQRQAAYPSLRDQQDMQYWDAVNGTTTWQDAISTVKQQFPKTTIDADELSTYVEAAWQQHLFNSQLESYTKAVERLSRYSLETGRPEISEVIVDEPTGSYDAEGNEIILRKVTTRGEAAIEGIPLMTEFINEDGDTVLCTNPEVERDNQERAAAQAVVDSTPQEVKDYYESHK